MPMPFGDFSLEEFDGPGRIRVRTQVIPKHQRVALVWMTRHPNMDIGWTLPFALIKEKLLPQFEMIVFTLRDMIVGDGSPILVPRLAELAPDLIIQGCDGDLNVDHIFGP